MRPGSSSPSSLVTSARVTFRNNLFAHKPSPSSPCGAVRRNGMCLCISVGFGGCRPPGWVTGQGDLGAKWFLSKLSLCPVRTHPPWSLECSIPEAFSRFSGVNCRASHCVLSLQDQVSALSTHVLFTTCALALPLLECCCHLLWHRLLSGSLPLQVPLGTSCVCFLFTEASRRTVGRQNARLSPRALGAQHFPRRLV